MDGRIAITGKPEFSAIYFALLKNGYEFYAMGKETGLAEEIEDFRGSGDDFDSPFFRGVRQNTCEVYPYWPRAAALETATFFLTADGARFGDFDGYRVDILSAGNLSDAERNEAFWDWVKDFPAALAHVRMRKDFRDYREWERGWIARQNLRYEDDLRRIREILDACAQRYTSKVKTLSVVLSPIKCAYSADYHMAGDTLVFSSGAFGTESIVHEYLHHVVHPLIGKYRGAAAGHAAYPGIDPSYALEGGEAGKLNAFEEYVVRELTAEVVARSFPPDIIAYIDGLIRALPARP